MCVSADKVDEAEELDCDEVLESNLERNFKVCACM